MLFLTGRTKLSARLYPNLRIIVPIVSVAHFIHFIKIREPWRRLVSSYHYFRIAEIGEVPSANFTEYVRNIEKYDRIYRSPEKLLGLPSGKPRGIPKQCPCRFFTSEKLSAIQLLNLCFSGLR
jgi:hypothetical protein